MFTVSGIAFEFQICNYFIACEKKFFLKNEKKNLDQFRLFSTIFSPLTKINVGLWVFAGKTIVKRNSITQKKIMTVNNKLVLF